MDQPPSSLLPALCSCNRRDSVTSGATCPVPHPASVDGQVCGVICMAQRASVGTEDRGDSSTIILPAHVTQGVLLITKSCFSFWKPWFLLISYRPRLWKFNRWFFFEYFFSFAQPKFQRCGTSFFYFACIRHQFTTMGQFWSDTYTPL